MCNVLLILSFLLFTNHATYAMDTPPPKEEPKREKGSLVARLQFKRDPSPTPSPKPELSIPEKNRPQRLVNSAPSSFTAKNIDHSKKTSTISGQPENNPQKNTHLPTIIATSSGHKPSQLTLEEMIAAQPITEERDTRSKDKRSKHTFSRSLSPAKKDKEKNIQDKLSSSDPGKNIFRKSPRDKSPRKNPSKKTISPQKSPRYTPSSTEFKSIIDAIHHEKTDPIKDFLSNFKKNPNEIVKGELTLLHHAVFTAMNKNNPSLVECFLLAPHVNSLIKSKTGYAPYQLIIEGDRAKHNELFKALLLRAQLDRIIHAMIIMEKALISEECSNEIIVPKIKSLLSRIPHKMLPDYADCSFILGMICSRRQYDLLNIQKTWNEFSTNANHQDECGYTMLHHAACLRDKVKIEELVKNPLIKSKQNNDKFFPQALIEPLVQNPEEPINPLVEYTEEIRAMLFVRNSIDSWIEQEIILFTDPMAEQCTLLKPNDPYFQNTIKKSLTDYFEKIATSQKGDTGENIDRTLPKENAEIPSYANDEFILALLLTYLKERKPQNHTKIEGFNPNPVFTESSESQQDTKEHTNSTIDTQLANVQKKLMEEIDSGAVRPIGSDSSLVALDSSSSSTLVPAKDNK